MKRTILFLCGLFVVLGIWAVDSPKREFRATWLATVKGIDWPIAKATSHGDINAQKRELLTYFDQFVEGNMNVCCLQVRPTADAFYQSSYEPWSAWLTGTRGENPGYDPLAFAVEEAHKRGLELHIWVNPFRVTTEGVLPDTDQVAVNCKQWIIKYDNGSFNGQIIDPGYPEVRKYVVNVLMEIVNNYDIDGVLMDDYFYPYGGTTTEDAHSLSLYKPSGMTALDWRISNVNEVVKTFYDSIQTVKPWVRYGMGPFGIWTTTHLEAARKYGISLPAGIRGLDAYDVLACDPIAWIQGGYIDYISPQLYWSTTASAQDYDVLSKWWYQDVCDHFSKSLPNNQRVDCFVSQAVYRFGSDELGLQVDDNRKFSTFDAPGSVFYNSKSYFSISQNAGERNIYLQMRKSHFQYLALPPAMTWKTTKTLTQPTQLALIDGVLSWEHPDAQRFTVYAFPKGLDPNIALNSGKYLRQVCYSKSLDVNDVYDFHNTTFAVCAYDRMGNEYAPAFYNLGETQTFYAITVQSANTSYGDVTGTGDYCANSDALITAMPFYGYQFAHWNDGDTHNPRLLNVTTDATYTATFCVAEKPDAQTGNLLIDTLWRYTSQQTDWMTTAGNATIACTNGELYLSDANNRQYIVLSASTGTLLRTQPVENLIDSISNLRCTDDGWMSINPATDAHNTLSVYTCDATSGILSPLTSVTNKYFGATRYGYPFGSMSREGYLIYPSNDGGKLLRIHFADEKVLPPTIVSTHDFPAGDAIKAIPLDANSCFITMPGRSIYLHSIWTGERWDTWGRNRPKTQKNVSGCMPFTLCGHQYIAVPANEYGSIEVWDITNSMSRAKCVISATSSLGNEDNSLNTIDFATYQEDNCAYLYVLAPDNGIAAYRLTFTNPESAINTTRSHTHSTTQIYDLSGRFVGTDIQQLHHGVFIIVSDNQRSKIVR